MAPPKRPTRSTSGSTEAAAPARPSYDVGLLRGDAGIEENTDHLRSLDKLLRAAQELMTQEPGLDREAFEYLRRLRVKVRFALSSASPQELTALPTNAPMLFEQRKDRDQSPLSFVQATYEPWLGKGICRADIKKLDKKLYDAFFNWRVPSEELDAIGLPTKRKLNDAKLAAVGHIKAPSRTLKLSELPPADRERLRLYNLAKNRKVRPPR